MGRKRRGSQAFTFEQSEETLLQNEAIVKLYQNKTFEPPEPTELETIREEGSEGTAKRSKRGESDDGSLVLGVSRSRRIIVDYKFWKQDDKEKNRKRKLKISKQWKGRKRIKIKPLDFHLEQQLIDLIADRVSSDEEDCMGDCEDNLDYLSSQCVWGASDYRELNVSHAKEVDHGDCSNNPVEHLTHSSPQCVSVSERETSPSDFTPRTTNSPGEKEEFINENDVMSKLQGLIPESELAELLQCEDFLFCSSKENKAKDEPPAKATAEKAREMKDSRRSVRRSARIMSVPNLIGSVFTGAQGESEDEENLDPRKEKKTRKKKPTEVPVVKRKRTKKCTPQGSSRQVLEDLSNQQEEQTSSPESHIEEQSSEPSKRSNKENSSSVKNKRRKSYSLEDGGVRYSLDGSRRNSVLTVSGEREINISLPESVRRSLSVDSNLHSRYVPTPSPLPFESQPSNTEQVKGCISSDEEEVVISGNLRQKTKKSFKKYKHEKLIEQILKEV